MVGENLGIWPLLTLTAHPINVGSGSGHGSGSGSGNLSRVACQSLTGLIPVKNINPP